jgi:hypothetical protein
MATVTCSHLAHYISSAEIQVCCVLCRALGGLLASHVAVTQNPDIAPGYNGILLAKAQELARQLLPAFDTTTGIPVSWVNLKNGRIAGDVEDTCVACAVTLVVEFRLLSHLTGNPIYGEKVDHAVSVIFSRRNPKTHLVGNTLWTTTGEWERLDAGIGAGSDSYYEYLLKTYLIFGDEGYLDMFVDQYTSVQRHMAVQGTWQGFSWLLDVHMSQLGAIKAWVSSLSAFWPALQVCSFVLQCMYRMHDVRGLSHVVDVGLPVDTYWNEVCAIWVPLEARGHGLSLLATSASSNISLASPSRSFMFIRALYCNATSYLNMICIFMSSRHQELLHLHSSHQYHSACVRSTTLRLLCA